ncbi:MAG TPA: TonB-dependent receptor [Cytophagales bacterium]|jgi:hemoglobin/transferrin/lactoferrin receptor protein|nr:TonB-dependent receptor [Cytophagales bacterium]
MRSLCILLFSTAVYSIGYAQTIKVVDNTTLLPIEYATLNSENKQSFVTTDARGEANISIFKGAKAIEVRKLGYKPAIFSYETMSQPGFRVELEPSNLNLDEVVVSATRWRQSTSDVPSKIIGISTEEIAIQNPQTAADLLGISGKVFVQKSQQGGGSPMIRGFATNRLLYTVDGVRMNTAIFRGGNIQNVINLDPFATQNVEVLFGPGSVIYGSDAIGGVMSFQTLEPQLSTTGKARVTGNANVRFSSANLEKTGHFDVNIGWKKWALVSSVSAWDYDHLRQGSNGPLDYVKPYYVQWQDSMDVIVQQNDNLKQIPSAYSQLNLMQKVRFQPSQRWDLQYGFHYSETSPYGRYDRHNRIRNELPRYGEWSYGPQMWMMNNLSARHTGNGRLYDEMTLRLAQQSFEESRISRNFNDPEREVRTEKVEAYSVNLDFVVRTDMKNTLFYGFEYVANDVNSSGLIENIESGNQLPGPSRYPQSIWQSIALYVNDEYEVNQKLTLQGGLRYNRFILDADFDTTFYPFPFTQANINNGALTGSLGGVIRPTDRFVIKLYAGTAFRSPNVDDIGKVFDSEPGAVTIPNPDLKAEYAYNFDIGLAKVFDDFLKLDVTAYYTILRNALVRRDYTFHGEDSILYEGVLSRVQALQNAAKATVYGLQFGMEVKFNDKLNLSSDLNIQKGEEELDDGSASPSRHAAPLFGATRLTYQMDKLDLQLYANYQGTQKAGNLAVEERRKDEVYARDSSGNNYAPSWHTINIKAIYQINANFSVSAGIENITDQRYRPYSSGISGPGTNYIISLRGHF